MSCRDAAYCAREHATTNGAVSSLVFVCRFPLLTLTNDGSKVETRDSV